MAAAPFDWNVVVAIGTVAGVALAGGAGLRTVWGERRTKREGDDERLERIELLLAGKGPDPKTNMPAIPGLVDDFRSFKGHMERELTTNSGSSLKDQLRGLSTEVAGLRQAVGDLQEEVSR